jgi:hypothetical protein
MNAGKGKMRKMKTKMPMKQNQPASDEEDEKDEPTKDQKNQKDQKSTIEEKVNFINPDSIR